MRRDVRARESRAGQSAGQVSDRSPILSASEIGSYAFCPEAWYLQRSGRPVSAEAEGWRERGRQAHRRIGLLTFLVVLADLVRKLLLGAIVLLVLLVVAQGAGLIP